MKAMDLLDEDIMTAHLVAGRRWFYAQLNPAELDSACHNLDEWSERLGLPLVLLGQTCLDMVDPSENGYGFEFSWIIGVHIASADDGEPAAVAAEVIDNAVAAAKALPWEELIADLPGPFSATDDGPMTPYEEQLKAINEQVNVWLLATGGGAGAKLAYGVLFSGEDDQVLDPDTGLADVAPGLDIIRGTGLAQSPHEQATYGVRLAGALFCDDEKLIDVSPHARRESAAKMGELADQAGYVLMTHYD